MSGLRAGVASPTTLSRSPHRADRAVSSAESRLMPGQWRWYQILVSGAYPGPAFRSAGPGRQAGRLCGGFLPLCHVGVSYFPRYLYPPYHRVAGAGCVSADAIVCHQPCKGFIIAETRYGSSSIKSVLDPIKFASDCLPILELKSSICPVPMPLYCDFHFRFLLFFFSTLIIRQLRAYVNIVRCLFGANWVPMEAL